MSSSLSSLVDNLSEGLHCDKCKDYMSVKDDPLIFRCFECKNNYKKDFNLIKNWLKDLQLYMNFVMKTLINLLCY